MGRDDIKQTMAFGKHLFSFYLTYILNVRLYFQSLQACLKRFGLAYMARKRYYLLINEKYALSNTLSLFFCEEVKFHG